MLIIRLMVPIVKQLVGLSTCFLKPVLDHVPGNSVLILRMPMDELLPDEVRLETLKENCYQLLYVLLVPDLLLLRRGQ